jgi:hypothetical protein
VLNDLDVPHRLPVLERACVAEHASIGFRGFGRSDVEIQIGADLADKTGDQRLLRPTCVIDVHPSSGA